jgi:hypothetical protein
LVEKIQEMDKQLQAIKAEKVLMGMRLAAAEARHRVQFGDKATVVNKLHLELEGMHETKNRYKRLHEDALREVEEVREAMAWRAAEWRMEREELEHEQLKAMDENRAYYELQLEERDRRIAELNGELQSVRHTSQAELEVTKREEQKVGESCAPTVSCRSVVRGLGRKTLKPVWCAAETGRHASGRDC